MRASKEATPAGRDLLLGLLARFFAEGSRWEEMLEVTASKNPPISLRSLDWLVTNYSKKHSIVLGGTPPVSMHRAYKNQLRAFSKKSFDPFCRRDRIEFSPAPGTVPPVRTTLGQLNFFRWAIGLGVLDFARQHASEIERDMATNVTGKRRRGQEGEGEEGGGGGGGGDGPSAPKRRREISENRMHGVQVHRVPVTVVFE